MPESDEEFELEAAKFICAFKLYYKKLQEYKIKCDKK